jgi:hypothetical protein
MGRCAEREKTYLGQRADVINLAPPSWIDRSEGLGYRGASSTWTKTPFDTFEGVNSTRSVKEWGRKENREGVTNKLQQKKTNVMLSHDERDTTWFRRTWVFLSES